MTHFKALIETDWLGQWDLPVDRDVVVTIETVDRFNPARRLKKKMPDGSTIDEPNKRLSIGFRGKRKHWLAGPVSQKAISDLYGPHVEQWIGKQIALYVDPKVAFGRNVTGGVRVRPSIPKGRPSAEPLDNPVNEERAALIAEAKESAE